MTKPLQPNNILITGLPKSGKSTLLKNITSRIERKQGMVVEEARTHGVRTGFKMVTASSATALLASVDGYSPITVGKYFVHTQNLNYLIPPLQTYQDSDLLYMDEIGPMQMHSELFRQLTLRYLEAPNLLLATITQEYSNPFIEAVKSRPDVYLIEITTNTRDEAAAELNRRLSMRVAQYRP